MFSKKRSSKNSGDQLLLLGVAFTLVCIVLLIRGIFLINLNSNADSSIVRIEVKEAGVRVIGYGSEGSIENTNEYPVRIRQVLLLHAETTQSLEVFEPGETRKQYIDTRHGFHIYTMDGIEVGWIGPPPN